MNDWTIPQPRSANTKGCAYWPDSCFLELNDIPELDALLQSEPDRPQLDLSSADADVIGLIGHENTHWIQAVCFGYGLYQAQIDQVRTEIAEAFFDLNGTELSEYLLRERSRGKRILSYEPSGDLIPSQGVGPMAARLQRHWLGLGLLRYSLDSGKRIWTEEASLRFFLGLARLYAAAGPNVSEVALLPDTELFAAACDAAPAGDLELREFDDSKLSSSALAECGAVLDEHWFYAYQSEWCRQRGRSPEAERWWAILDKSWKRRESTFYGDAFRVFAEINPSLDLNQSTPLATLGVITSLALDGTWSGGARRPRWRDVYPPIRFRAFSQAVQRVGMLPAYSVYKLTPAAYEEYIRTLCAEADVAPPQLSLSTLCSDAHWEPSPNNDLRRLFSLCASAGKDLYRRYPASIVAPSEANVYLEEILKDESFDHLRPAREAPLLVLNGQMSSLHFDDRENRRFAVAGIYQRLLMELMRSTGKLSQAGRPGHTLGEQLAREAVGLAERRLRISLNDFAVC